MINSGSSSVKCSLFDASANDLSSAWNAQIAWTGKTSYTLTWHVGGEDSGAKQLNNVDYETAVEACLKTMYSYAVVKDRSESSAVAHRIVHGGGKYKQSALITESVMHDIESFVELAPAHQPGNIKGIRLASNIFPGLPQIASFDTAFHHTLPITSAIYAGPYEWFKQGIRRYGFHGISHQYCAQKSAELVGKPLDSLRVVTCHLGSGCSLAAIRYAESVMTTMGFTPLEGLVMRTRSGSIDPGLILHFLQEKKHSPSELRNILNSQSGLKGLSGLSGDMREIEAQMKQGQARAHSAFAVFFSALSAQISALLPTLGGTDLIAFTGGIGENSAAVRSACITALSFLGLIIDTEANASTKSDCLISTLDSKVAVCVVRANEEQVIARDCLEPVKLQSTKS
ncbi:MAG: acetate/propionate family kinase [Pyrinomonadaceae bacterium]